MFVGDVKSILASGWTHLSRRTGNLGCPGKDMPILDILRQSKIPSQRSQVKDIPSQESEGKDPKPKIPRNPSYGCVGVILAERLSCEVPPPLLQGQYLLWECKMSIKEEGEG